MNGHANEGDDIWVLAYNGPRCAVFCREWQDKGKVLIEFHGTPEIVDAAACFRHKRECYAAAAAKEQQKAMDAMTTAAEWGRIAANLPMSESVSVTADAG